MASASSMGRPVIAPASWGLTPPFVSVPQARALAAMSAAPIPEKSKLRSSTSSASPIWSAMMRPTGSKVRCRKRRKSSFLAVPSDTDMMVTGTPAAAMTDSSARLRSWTIARRWRHAETLTHPIIAWLRFLTLTPRCITRHARHQRKATSGRAQVGGQPARLFWVGHCEVVASRSARLLHQRRLDLPHQLLGKAGRSKRPYAYPGRVMRLRIPNVQHPARRQCPDDRCRRALESGVISPRCGVNATGHCPVLGRRQGDSAWPDPDLKDDLPIPEEIASDVA